MVLCSLCAGEDSFPGGQARLLPCQAADLGGEGKRPSCSGPCGWPWDEEGKRGCSEEATQQLGKEPNSRTFVPSDWQDSANVALHHSRNGYSSLISCGACPGRLACLSAGSTAGRSFLRSHPLPGFGLSTHLTRAAVKAEPAGAGGDVPPGLPHGPDGPLERLPRWLIKPSGPPSRGSLCWRWHLSGFKVVASRKSIVQTAHKPWSVCPVVR